MASEVEEAERERKSLEEQLQQLKLRNSREGVVCVPSRAEAWTNEELPKPPGPPSSLLSWLDGLDCSTQSMCSSEKTPGSVANSRDNPAIGKRGVGLCVIKGLRGELVGDRTRACAPRLLAGRGGVRPLPRA
jgi:hypothetical protein